MSKIKLLDGKYYDKAELLKRMDDDTFYYGELNELALSSSSLKLLLSSPKTYKFSMQYGSGDSSALRMGALFHWAILEPSKFSEQKFIEVQSRNTKKFRVPAIDNISAGDFTMPFRGKADVLATDRIVDLKTSASNLKDFHHSANKYGYDVQCYLYCNLFKRQYKDFHFLVLDKGSLDIGIFNCSEEFYYRGEEKVQKALDLYNKFFIEGADLDNYCLTGEL